MTFSLRKLFQSFMDVVILLEQNININQDLQNKTKTKELEKQYKFGSYYKYLNHKNNLVSHLKTHTGEKLFK